MICSEFFCAGEGGTDIAHTNTMRSDSVTGRAQPAHMFARSDFFTVTLEGKSGRVTAWAFYPSALPAAAREEAAGFSNRGSGDSWGDRA